MASEAFLGCISALKLTRSQPVVVAVSGGIDSMALTHLARQAFSRVVGVTVDHRLREESAREAVEVGELVTKMGVEHRVLTVDWEGSGRGGGAVNRRIQELAREKRYSLLFRLCQQLGIEVLMTGHHFNDQLETFVHRLSKGSGIDGLACMAPSTTTFHYPTIHLVRPLLQCSKVSLEALCREQGLGWVEDPSNFLPIYQRNVIRKVLDEQPELCSGLAGVMETCHKARTAVEPQVLKVLKSIPFINQQYGYLTVPLDRFRRLSLPVARRALSVMLAFASGSRDTKLSHVMAAYQLCTNPEGAKVISVGKCNLIPIDEKHVVIARQLPHRSHIAMHPIRTGETILWDGRFEITLKGLRTHEKRGKREELQAGGREAAVSPSSVFYVRNMIKSDWHLARKGIRKVRSSILPLEHVRGGLPVVVDSNRKVVLIPHFAVIDRSAGVTCDVRFNPPASLEDHVLYPLLLSKNRNQQL